MDQKFCFANMPAPHPRFIKGLRGRKKVAILSIDGGGIRGLVPALMIQHIECITGKRVCEIFDVVAGTSTGALLSMLCTLPDSLGSKRPSKRTTGDELVKLYMERGSDIFPTSEIRDELDQEVEQGGKKSALAQHAAQLVSKAKKAADGAVDEVKDVVNKMQWVTSRAKYRATGLEKVLHEFLDMSPRTLTLSDTVVPIFISTVEVGHPWGPCFFSSLDATADGMANGSNYRLVDVARATSAAPTYLPPIRLNNTVVQSDGTLKDGNVEMTCVDGGICCNNPALAAYNYVRSITDPGCEIIVVSLGTGRVAKRYELEQMETWGVAQWVGPLIGIMMGGTSQLMSNQLEMLTAGTDAATHHRFQMIIPEDYTINSKNAERRKSGVACEQLDNTAPKNLEALTELVHTYLTEDGRRLKAALDEVMR